MADSTALRFGGRRSSLPRSCEIVVILESEAMPARARLFAPDRVEIVDLDSWFSHAPPEGLRADV
jgi:hypothetical protein